MTGSIIDADVTLFEVGRRLEYSSQRKEKKEFTHRQRRKMSKYPITAKGKEGKRAKTSMERGRRAKLTGKMQILLYNTKHTHTHTCFQNIVSSVSRVFIHASHTHTYTHKRSQFMSLSGLYMFVMKRGWGFPLSLDVSELERC